MSNPRGGSIVQSYRDFLRRVSLLWRDRLDIPSIQLAEWAEANLPSGEYCVHFRGIDGNYEIEASTAGGWIAGCDLARARRGRQAADFAAAVMAGDRSCCARAGPR